MKNPMKAAVLVKFSAGNCAEKTSRTWAPNYDAAELSLVVVSPRPKDGRSVLPLLICASCASP